MPLVGQGHRESALTGAAVREIMQAGLSPLLAGGTPRLLGIIPDKTRSFSPNVVHAFIEASKAAGARCDLLIANGTHAAMSQAEIDHFLKPETAAPGLFDGVTVYNHTTRPEDLCPAGTIDAATVSEISGGRISKEIHVTINHRVFEYDAVVIIGPVFPHEVVGMSGGHKYLFPGVAGVEIIDQSHWLGALIGIHDVIGRSETPVRKLVEYAGAMLERRVPLYCASLVMGRGGLHGLWFGNTIESHRRAAALSREVNIVWTNRRYRRVVAECPEKYDELWTGGKLAYKTQEVVEEGGEIVLYAPHLKLITPQHPDVEHVGYHCLAYFLGQWDRFAASEPSALAHSTHVCGPGTFANGVETLAARRILASALGPERCAAMNLGYLNPDTIDFAHHQPYGDEDTLWVPQAGEQLFMCEDMRSNLEER